MVSIGNKTECALLELAYKMNFNYKTHRKQEHVVKVYPFSSKVKSMATIGKIN